MGKKSKIKEVKILTTIFDKAVDAAENQAGAKPPGFSFSNLQYNQRDEVILPYAHRLDQRSVRVALHDYYQNFVHEVDNKVKENIKNMLKTKKLISPHNSDWNTVCRLVSQEYKDYVIPEHLVNDLFTLFYNPIDKLDFADRIPDNMAKYKMIEKLNNSVLKVITYSNPVKTMIIVRAMITHMLITMVFGKYGTDPDDAQDMQDLVDMLSQKQNPHQSRIAPPDQSAMPGQGQSNSGDIIQKPKGNQGVNQGSGQNGSNSQGNQQAPADPMVQNQQLESDFFDDEQNPPQQQKGLPQADPAGNSQQDPNNPSQADPQDDEDNIQAGDQYDDYEELDPDEDADTDNSGLDEDGYDVQQDNGKNEGSGSGNTNISSLDDQLSKIMTRMYDDKQNKKLLDNAIDAARETIENIEELMTDESMKTMWEDLNIDKKELLARINPEKLKKLEEELRKLKVNASGLRETIKHLLDKSISYFSSKEESFFENILETDNIAELIDWPLLHPKIRNVLIEDIMVRNSRKIGKIDCYVDVSGSMEGSCGFHDEKGHSVTCATLAKAITLKIKQMDLLDELYTFESSVHPTGNELIDVLLMDGGGGTELENVILHVQQGTKNAVIITDACDHVETYSSKAFFIGVAGSNFCSFDRAALKKYIDSSQIIIFDGKSILKVGYDGRAIEKNRLEEEYA